MAKVQFVKAGKDYPQFGIKKGDMHYVWSMKMQRGGVTKRSLDRPRASQLTLSPFKSQAHRINEEIEDITLGEEPDISILQAAQQDLIDQASELRDETQDSLDNMPEGLQQGSTGELLQERLDALETFIQEIENLGFDVEFTPEEPEDDGQDEELGTEADADGAEPRNAEEQTELEWLEALLEELKAISLDVC